MLCHGRSGRRIELRLLLFLFQFRGDDFSKNKGKGLKAFRLSERLLLRSMFSAIGRREKWKSERSIRANRK